MSIAQSEFWTRLIQSGLADEASCQRYAAEFSKTADESAANGAKSVAGFLVRAGVLTKFQAAKFIESDESSLRIGPFVMTDDRPVAPFSHWIPVQTAVTDQTPESRRGFLLRVPLAGLDEGRRGWLAVHSEIVGETLQPIELSGGAQSEGADQTVEIFSPIPEGASLLKVLQTKQKLSSRKTVRIGVDLANALQALHTPTGSGVTLAHGAVGADHVWVTPKGRAVLLRDPSSPARSPRSDLSTSWIERIESPALYSAPELSDPAAFPTPACDIYSLGCLLFSLIVGRPAFEGEDDRELFAAHNEDLPKELIAAAEQGAAGNPILRVLAYAMAKDPGVRFGTASAFGEALAAAGEMVEGKKLSSSGSRIEQKSEPEPSKAKTSAEQSPRKASPKKSAEPKPAPESQDKPKASSVETPAVAESSPPSKKSATRPKVVTSKPDVPDPVENVDHESPGDPSVDSSSVNSTPASSTPASSAEIASIEVREAATVVSATSDESASLASDSPVTNAVQADVQVASSADQDGGPSESQPRLRKRRKRKKNRIPILAGMMVVPLLLLGLAIALRGRGPEKRPPRPRPRPGIVQNVPRVPDSRRDVEEDATKLVNGYEIVDSDRLLWVPPFAADSKPPSLSLLPPGPAAIISVQLARVLESKDASSFTSTFAKEIDQLTSAVEKRAGVGRSEIKRCTAALFPGKNGWPEVALAIELKNPIDVKTISEKWKAFESRTADGMVLYAGEASNADAYFIGGGEKGKLPADAKVERFAVASLERIQEVAESEGGEIPLARNMQTLWNQTSSDSDFVAMMTPNFLFADGRELVNSSVPEFAPGLKQWLIPDVAAVSLAASAKDNAMYVELRELASGGANAAKLLKSFRDSVATWPDWADGFILGSVPDPSWRLLATRLPLMLRFVAQQTRSTILGETVVASTYLPADAGAQVSLATFLAMNTAPGGDSLAQAPTAKALTVDDMLERPMSISFLQLSLQFAVDAVVDEFKQSLPSGSTMPNVRIVGGDLEKNGITQNQQIRGFERDSQPLRKVLTDLVLGANPDKTAEGPNDPKQSLVWVVHPQGKSPAETEILITTRDAAKDQYELPIEFRIEQ